MLLDGFASFACIGLHANNQRTCTTSLGNGIVWSFCWQIAMEVDKPAMLLWWPPLKTRVPQTKSHCRALQALNKCISLFVIISNREYVEDLDGQKTFFARRCKFSLILNVSPKANEQKREENLIWKMNQMKTETTKVIVFFFNGFWELFLSFCCKIIPDFRTKLLSAKD